MTDRLLARLSYDPGPQKLEPIPWPAGLAPKVQRVNRDPASVMPQADVLLGCWTTAEAAAMADVFTPGLHHTRWERYTHNWAGYEGQLTDESPAKDEGCLAHYAICHVGKTKVVVWKSELHLATDAASLPLRGLWGQLISEAQPRLVIDSGTSGGIGPDVAVGDTVAAVNARFDCTGFLKDEPYAHENFPCTYNAAALDYSQADALMATNAHLLAPQTKRPVKVWAGDVLTCDSFLFDDVEETYGLERADSAALCEEMDLATLGLVAQDLGSEMPPWCSLRSISDPQMPQMSSIEAEKRAASVIYDDYGYAAQVMTAMACWQMVASYQP